MVNRETMSKEQEKKQFAIFLEDYNTATLPHEKYYVGYPHLHLLILPNLIPQNMAKYEKRMNQIRNGELLPQSSEYDPSADLAAHSASHKRSIVEHESFLSKEQLGELRKVQMERIEVSHALGKGDPQLFITAFAGRQDESTRPRSEKFNGRPHGWERV
jgi:hypothetical protein